MSQKIYQLVTDRIIALLQQGVVPWMKPWTTNGRSAAPVNLLSGRPYRGVNVFLLIAQGFGSPYWLTFRQAQDRGGHVRRHEHGTPIIFWRVDDPETSEGADGEEGLAEYRRVVLRYYTVFNVEQCEGIEIPATEAAEAGSAFDLIPACEAVYANMPHPPELRHAGDHSTGHPSRLNRFAEEDNPGIFGSPAYAREELVAEMTAAMICGVLGIAPVKVEAITPDGQEDLLLESSAAYLRHWMDVLKADTRAVVIAATRAQKAADYILGTHQQEEARQRDEAA